MKSPIIISIVVLLCFCTKSYSQNNWQVSVSGGLLSHEFLISEKLGVVVEGTIFYEISDSIMITLSTGYHKWNEPFGNDGNKFKSFPILAGLRVPIIKGKISPYLFTEAGVELFNREYTFEIYKISERGLPQLVSSFPRDEATVKLSFRFGFGTTINLYDHFSLDVALRYSRTRYDYVYVYPDKKSRGTLNLYNIIIGLIYKI